MSSMDICQYMITYKKYVYDQSPACIGKRERHT